MTAPIPGIHHVTAIAGEPRENHAFYAGFLGLRLVKKTVNFDDPTTYHLYFGDELGRPGSIMTFFPWPGAARGRRGTGQLTTTAFSVPGGSLEYWAHRAAEHGVGLEGPTRRLDEELVTLTDVHGLALELVARDDDDREGWSGGPVPPEHAVRGFHGVTLCVDRPDETVEMLSETLGFTAAVEEGRRLRFAASDGGPGTWVDVTCEPDAPAGRGGVGTVHHVAFGIPTDEAQAAWRERIADAGYDVTPVVDRQYFRSIYFREPGGVLFEIATDPPGFTRDESPEHLGEALKLPPWYESSRAIIESRLPPLGSDPVAGG